MGKREILFRGKHIHVLPENKHLNGTWIYGYLCEENYINSPELKGGFLIVPETVCQYTGLTDKNGRKIFERDIIKVTDCGVERGTGDVSLEDGAWYVSGELQERLHWLDDYIDYEFEVIGNIFDNPDLIV